MIDESHNHMQADAFDFCKSNIEVMLRRSQNKVIFPLITLGLLRDFAESGKCIFSDDEIRKSYETTVRFMERFLEHNLHIGGKYYDAYPSRNLPKYAVLKPLENRHYELQSPYKDYAALLIEWIPARVRQHIVDRLGIIPKLVDHAVRVEIALDDDLFLATIRDHIDQNPTNFEVFTFSILKVHLEKFACRLYRDTRTSAHDTGVDLSTNFGVVYQIKKLKVLNTQVADHIYDEIRSNFDNQRISDGNIIIVIDEVSKDVKSYLIDMKVQSISKRDILKMAAEFEDVEDRQKVLRIIHDEFRREYSSAIKMLDTA